MLVFLLTPHSGRSHLTSGLRSSEPPVCRSTFGAATQEHCTLGTEEEPEENSMLVAGDETEDHNTLGDGEETGEHNTIGDGQ
jgi:hypothetical protein